MIVRSMERRVLTLEQIGQVLLNCRIPVTCRDGRVPQPLDRTALHPDNNDENEPHNALERGKTDQKNFETCFSSEDSNEKDRDGYSGDCGHQNGRS